ncbi:MAG: Sugar fermentation stimulation protein A [Proteobacteria bacterium]|jgi:sugar fermentation stimulation protein A|nr:MAG: Sugar fermentation stimulation protein A [Pseudomonadota bacterium]|tara:strand:+ start:853 stop:1551 length:699 start_codon:yes stop_codon:yes gene_type:complete
MKFQDKLIKGRFIKRYKRFFADVELNDGSTIVSHCPNTGSMKGLLDFDYAYVSHVDDPKRKLKYTLQIIEQGDVRVGVNTHLTNNVAIEGVKQGLITELKDFKELKPEVKYGSQNSRIDILLTHEDDTLHYVEVKNTTLAEGTTAKFPDAVTTRGQKHLQELMEMVEQGHKATMLYVVNRNDCSTFEVAEEIDPQYATLLKQAAKAGVQILAYSCILNDEEIKIDSKLEVVL